MWNNREVIRHRDINKEYSNSADREIFSRYVSRRPECFSTKLSWRASSFFCQVRRKRERKTFTLLLSLLDPLGSKVVTSVYVCVYVWVCIYLYVSSVFIPLPQQHSAILLTTYLTHDLRPCLPRVRAWWPSKTQILSVVRSCPRWEQGTPQGP